MFIKETGEYKLTEDWSSRGSRSIRNFSKDAILEITQVDISGHKVIGPAFKDWAYWNIPATKVTGIF